MRQESATYGQHFRLAMKAAIEYMPTDQPKVWFESAGNWVSGPPDRDPHRLLPWVGREATARGGKLIASRAWQWVDRRPELMGDRLLTAPDSWSGVLSPEEHRLGELPHLDINLVWGAQNAKRTRRLETYIKGLYAAGEIAGTHDLYLNEQQPQVEQFRFGLEDADGEVQWGRWTIGLHAAHASSLDGPAIVVEPDDPWYLFWTTSWERFRNTSVRCDEVPEGWGDPELIYARLAAAYHLWQGVTWLEGRR